MRRPSSRVSHARRLAVPVVAAAVCAAPVRAESDAPPRPELPGGITDKPYLGGRGRVAVGGYIDHEFEWVEHGGSTFDQHRFIPFITSEITDRVHVSAEIEFEHGGLVTGGGETDGEIKLEYAVLDFEIAESLVYRGGVILSPLGAFNLLHDSPLNDLTERPLVSRRLIPTTLSESGMGVLGTIYPSEAAVVSYELYVVNGFDEGIVAGEGEDARLRVRGGRGSHESDNNGGKAVVGRVGLSPALGSNVGASFHTGTYDDADEHRLTIAALDGRLTRGPLELQGEVALVSVGSDNPAVAERQRGGYGQVNLHLLHDRVLPGSVFTAVLRVDAVDFDTGVEGDATRALTAGANFRPVEDTVFKLDFAWIWSSAPGGAFGDALGRLFFSFASYF